MPKIDPFNLPRPDRREETRSFVEGGVTLELSLRAPDAADIARAAEVAERLTEDYITGSSDRAAGEFPEDVKVSKSHFTTCALTAEMQCGPEADRYSALEFVVLSTKLPGAWAGVQSWVSSLCDAWSATRGK